MSTETKDADERALMQQLRGVAENLPPADDTASGPAPAPPPPAAANARRKRLAEILIRVRWPLLAVAVASLLALGGASVAVSLGTSDVERWALATLAMLLIVAAVIALDIALQWSDGAVFALVRQHEADVMEHVRREAMRLYGPTNESGEGRDV